MTQFYELIARKNKQALTKEQICDLRGGRLRGEQIFIVTHTIREFGYAVYEVRVKNQMRSQKSPSHPEGYLPLKSELYGSPKNFCYDIARERAEVPFFQSWSPGKISLGWRSFPAVVLQPPCGSDDAILLRHRARDTEARERLLKALKDHPHSLPAANELLGEALGLEAANRSGTDPAEGILRCILDVDPHLADDLREAILAQGLLTAPAQPIPAVA